MVFDAPSSVSYDIKNAAEAWEEVLRTPLELFSYVIFTFPENLFAKTLDVHTSTKGGMTEMLQTIEDLTTTSSTPCWGGFKLHVVNADVSVRTAKFIGFQYVPAKAKINAKRVAKEVNPCVEELLSKGNLFLEADRLDQISDSIANCKIIAERLELPEDHSLQFHAVNVEAVATAWQKALTTELDYFSYVLCSVEKDVPYREVVAQSSKQGGLTEMLKEIKALAPQGPVWGAFKVHALGAKASDPVVQYIGFQYAPLETQASAERVIVELRPHVIGAFTQVKTFINVEAVEELPNVDMLSKALQLDASYTLQLHTVLNMKEAEAAFQEVFNSDLDHFAYAIVTAEEDELGKKTLTVQRSTEGGASEMVAALQKIRRPAWGVFKVHSIDSHAETPLVHVVAFQYAVQPSLDGTEMPSAPSKSPAPSRLVEEIRPLMRGALRDAATFVDVDNAEKLLAGESEKLWASWLHIPAERTLQLHPVKGVADVISACQEVLASPVDTFAYAIFTVTESPSAIRNIHVHRHTEGGATEMLEILKAQACPCWGAFKVRSMDACGNNTATKYVGFQIAPEQSACRLVAEVKPHVVGALDKMDAFIQVPKVEHVVDAAAIRAELQLPDSQLLQFHAVKGVNDIAAAYEEVINSAVDEFAYIVVSVEENSSANKTLSAHKSTAGGLTEMVERIKVQGSCYGAFKVQLVSETCERVTKHVAFQYTAPGADPISSEVKPFVTGVFHKADIFIETDTIEKLTERDYLMTELKVHPELTLQFRAVESQNAAAAWNEVLNTEVDDFAYAIFSLSDAHKYVEVLDVQKSTEGGITELVEKIKALSAEGRSVWGGFKVQSVDDRSLLRKKPKRAKFVGFQYMSDEAKTDVLEVIPFACSALDKFNLDMFIETADIADLENIEAIANHLKLNDEWTLYEFGGPVRCRTEIMMDLDSMGKHKLEVAQALDAWDKVLSNNDEETYCIFALSNDRTKLNVVIHGSGPGHKACEAATDAMLNQNRPVWGCFRLQGKNEKADKASCRTKYIGFQVIPPATKPLVRSTVNLVKPLVMRTLKQAIVWVEAESKECLTESVIIQKLGNDNTNEYDFGEALGAEAEKTIKECVESHFSIVEAKVAAPSEEKEETATPA
eukprot:GEMP01000960.1.p1 GENE.GEMP01000960.1~~GEMP01000960.1.p1  ORF type:complete len:1129 (+),score=310.77 GEMP01000960.1:69-3455(+)